MTRSNIPVKTMMLPEILYNSIVETMKEPDFAFQNITTFIVIASMSLQQGFLDAKKKGQQKKFTNELIKLSKFLVKEGLISDKLYGWKDLFKEQM